MAGERDSGLRALQSGDVDGAIRLLETACSMAPDDYQACIYLGAAYSKAGRSSDAIDITSHAVELQPSNPQARYNLATAMERGGHPEQASAVYEQALMLQPNYPKAREALQRIKGGTAATQPTVTAALHSAGQAPGPFAQSSSSALPAQPTMHSSAPQHSGGASQFGTPTAPSSAQQFGTPQAAAQPAYFGSPPAAAPTAPQPFSVGLNRPEFAAQAPLYGEPPPSLSSPHYGTLAGAAPPPFGQSISPPRSPGLGQYYSAPSPSAPPPIHGSPYAPPAAQPYTAQRPGTTYSPPAPAKAESFAGSVGMAILFGATGGALGTALWVGLILATHRSSGFIGLIVGGIVGFLIKKGNGGGSTTGGILASVITVLASVAGNLIALLLLPDSGPGVGIGFSIAGIFIAYRVASSD